MAGNSERGDRPGPLAKTSLVSTPGFTLTPDQVRKLEATTQAYLRKNKLPVSFQYFKQVQPVIRACVDDGFASFEQQGRTVNDIERLYTEGAKLRARQVELAKEGLEAPTPDLPFTGPYAIPAMFVPRLQKELDKETIALTPHLPVTKDAAQLVGQRKPIFVQLVELAKHWVSLQKEIPADATKKLTREQEAGLVRNLIFTAVATGEPKAIVQISEIFQNAKEWRLQSTGSSSLEVALVDLLKVLKGDPAVVKAYLKDLSAQISGTIEGIASLDLNQADDLNTAYIRTNKVFAVVDPFTGVESNSAGSQLLADESQTMVFTHKGKKYKSLSPEALRALGFQTRPKDPERSHHLMDLARRLNSVINRPAEPQTVGLPGLRVAVDNHQRKLDQVRDQLKSGTVPDEFRMNPRVLGADVNTQLKTMKDGVDLYDLMHLHTGLIRTAAIQVISAQLTGEGNVKYRYAGRKQADSIGQGLPIPAAFIDMYRASGVMTRRILTYERERVIQVIRGISEVYATEDFAKKEKGSLFDYRASRMKLLPKYFDRAMATTIVDMRKYQSNIWERETEVYLGNSDPELVRKNWGPIVDSYREHTIRRLVDVMIGQYGANAVAELLPSDTRSILEVLDDPKVQKVLQANYYGIGTNVRRLLSLEEHIAKGTAPDMSRLPYDIRSLWKSDREAIINSALSAWRFNAPLATSFSHFGVSGEDKGVTNARAQEESVLMQTLKDHPYGATILSVLTLMRLPIQGLWPSDITKTIRSFAGYDQSEWERYLRYGGDPTYIHHGDARYAWYVTALKDIIPGLVGKEIPESVWTFVLKQPFLRTMVTNGYTFGGFFSIEDEVRDWYAKQEARLYAQRHEAGILKVNPVYKLQELQANVSKAQQRLQDAEQRTAMDFSVTLKNLQTLGYLRALD